MTSPLYSQFLRCVNVRCGELIHEDDAHFFCNEAFCKSCYKDMLPRICFDIFAELQEAPPLMEAFASARHTQAQEAQAA